MPDLDRDLSLNDARHTAAGCAREWAELPASDTPEAAALRQLALWLCTAIRDGKRPFPSAEAARIAWPTPTALVAMGRREILSLANEASLAEAALPERDDVEPAEWARIMGALALSYAQAHDLSCVAALIRIGARLGLRDPWLCEAQSYLLDQQQPDGRFGLLGAEVGILGDESAAEALLRLQIEILWALSEAGSQEHEKNKAPRWGSPL